MYIIDRYFNSVQLFSACEILFYNLIIVLTLVLWYFYIHVQFYLMIKLFKMKIHTTLVLKIMESTCNLLKSLIFDVLVALF